MNTAKDVFDRGIRQTQQMTALYDHFVVTVKIPHDQVSDILRYQLVDAISALDRLIHELIRKGIVEMFMNNRTRTQKFLSQPFRAETMIQAITYSDHCYIPRSQQETAEYVVNKEINDILSTKSFQAPDKIKEGLSYIWDESQKSVKLARAIAVPGNTDNEKQQTFEQKLKLIVERRNQIVHEGDIDPVTLNKRDLTKQDTLDAIAFIEKIGHAIYDFVK